MGIVWQIMEPLCCQDMLRSIEQFRTIGEASGNFALKRAGADKASSCCVIHGQASYLIEAVSSAFALGSGH
ncbi:hypothetical protein DMX05_19515 [Pseudomonas soli]|nr:hypothetical protein C3F42_26670 [Pseudomonas sp. PONIH3]PYC37055.1 hypothetical protein DMX05_19515 [Pseudomonas soli]